MDKYLQLLNYYLDERDFLLQQQREALESGDFYQAHLLDDAVHYQENRLRKLERIFKQIERHPRRGEGPYQVNRNEKGDVLKNCCERLLARDSDLAELLIHFASRQGKPPRASISLKKRNRTLRLVLVKTVPEAEGLPFLSWDVARLKWIGWKPDGQNSPRYQAQMNGQGMQAWKEAEQLIARTVFEVIGEQAGHTELEVIPKPGRQLKSSGGF